jgi:hypothetical protein
MALVAMVEATVTYACRLSEEDEQKVYDYIGDTDLSVDDAIMELYDAGEIDLYKNSNESDFSTNYITEFYREDE